MPRVLVLTDRRQATGPLRDVVAAAVDAGARGVVLREKDLPVQARRALMARLAPVVHGAGGVLLAAGAHLRGGDGVHQPSHSTSPAPVSVTGRITGRSCHTADDLRIAERQGVDYVTVSPVYSTASKPGYGPPTGVEGLASLIGATTVPVYALGGIDTPEAVGACRSAGAHGVAVMGAIMRARRPGPLVAELLAAAEGDPP
ncbi:MAG: thiamine phosphate synthase [Acidimicrobiales bacterium]|nr:thiamine phosphate synthase [Acidimicrobiales bacterium]